MREGFDRRGLRDGWMVLSRYKGVVMVVGWLVGGWGRVIVLCGCVGGGQELLIWMLGEVVMVCVRG